MKHCTSHQTHRCVYIFPQESKLCFQTPSTVKTGNRKLAAADRARHLTELPHGCSEPHLILDLKARADSSETWRNRAVFYSTVVFVSKMCLVLTPQMLRF